MKHNEIKDKLFSLYDGPLTEKERVLVDGHLTDCPECHQAVEEWKRASNILFTLPAFSEASEDRVVAHVMEKIRLGSQGSSWKNNLRWLVPLMGSAIAAAWVFFSVSPDIPSLNQQPVAETFIQNGQPDAFTSLGATTDSPSDRFVQAVVYNY